MEDNANLLESLLEKTTGYVKTNYELIKLKILDNTSDVASSLISHSVVVIILACFFFFLNLGLAFWLGEILDSTYYGLFIIAAFYGIIGLFMHLFMHKWMKRVISDYIIKQILK
jgi:Putative Actinobacterial Holin-X, holin superfamily III